MKYFDITLHRNADRTLRYPENYQAEIGNKAVDHLYYDDETGMPRLLLAIKDADATGISRTDVAEITEAAARGISESKESAVTQYSNEAEVARIQLKIMRNQTLTQKEEDALDPTSDEPGFTTRKRFIDRATAKAVIEGP